jgi:hypothetical protein
MRNAEPLADLPSKFVWDLDMPGNGFRHSTGGAGPQRMLAAFSFQKAAMSAQMS